MEVNAFGRVSVAEAVLAKKRACMLRSPATYREHKRYGLHLTNALGPRPAVLHLVKNTDPSRFSWQRIGWTPAAAAMASDRPEVAHPCRQQSETCGSNTALALHMFRRL